MNSVASEGITFFFFFVPYVLGFLTGIAIGFLAGFFLFKRS